MPSNYRINDGDVPVELWEPIACPVCGESFGLAKRHRPARRRVLWWPALPARLEYTCKLKFGGCGYVFDVRPGTVRPLPFPRLPVL